MTAESDAPSKMSAAGRRAEEIKAGWRAGGRPDAAAALRDHPSLARFKSIVVDLAYEEFCLREEAGAAPDHGAFYESVAGPEHEAAGGREARSRWMRRHAPAGLGRLPLIQRVERDAVA